LQNLPFERLSETGINIVKYENSWWKGAVSVAVHAQITMPHFGMHAAYPLRRFPFGISAPRIGKVAFSDLRVVPRQTQ